MRLLIVEDDNRMAEALAAVMARHGFTVFRAATGAEALTRLDDAEVILLDLGLPDLDGLEVCRLIRQTCGVPLIVVTARADLAARVHGLNLGADDYMVKPVNGAELVARIHAVSRRSRGEIAATGTYRGSADNREDSGGCLAIGPLKVDPSTRVVRVDGLEIALTRKEFDLLELLAREPGLVYRREQLVAQVWGSRSRGTQRTLEVHVASLRAKLGVPELIDTVRGVGYRLVAGSRA